ncbi:ATP-binding protein [Pontibacillus marinus]|uniref:histidine kinase n=1 Tax=Pontibacillus marinus BH030004 = DSM 16465 TaxID=1385511 RepID=A0A0A5FZN6_9BACI|nr:ATP-binding protein [Pontibacillus marinus]KGX84298.1 hypothetical protein N783_17895 [Pontibacillus marinus BH030004 = DSM 16465]
MPLLTPEHVLSPDIAFTQNTTITNGTHILYTSTDPEKYLENATSFISSGLSLGQAVVFIDEPHIFNTITEQLIHKGFDQEKVASILFSDRHEFYTSNDIFDIDTVISSFSPLLTPFLQEGIPIRTWGKVKWCANQACFMDLIKKYEMNVDDFVNEMNTFSVCAYDGEELPASLQMELMKHHQYIMSDNEFVSSSFYENERLSPSIMHDTKQYETIENLHTQYSKLIDQLPDPVFISSNGTIAYVNEAATTLMECDFHDLVHLSLIDIIQEKFPEKNPLDHSGSPIEVKLTTSKGNTVEVEMYSFPFLNEERTVEATITIARDMKDKKGSQKLDMISQLAASNAHEIRNPLTAIKGFIELAKEGSLDLDIYSIIGREVERIELIAGELLVLGKPEQMTMDTIEINEILKHVCGLMKFQAETEQVNIQEDFQHNLFVRCNKEQLQQVFINLLKNAIESIEDEGNIKVHSYKDHNQVKIDVTDNGKGIPDHILKHVAEPFYTTKEKGSGIGLMVCYNLIEKHEGTINVQSNPGQGTTFTITLPLVSETKCTSSGQH